MIIDGKAVAQRIREQIAIDVEKLVAEHGIRPTLATVLVGEDPASHTYVRMKHKACADVGFETVDHQIDADIDQESLENLVHELNTDPRVHGILVQLPLPGHLNEEAVLNAISLEKDVDGFHPINIGHLAMRNREPLFMPATPAGCMVLLEEAGAQFEGANAVVLGRSNIVGLPAAMMLQQRDATVTIVHSRTKNPKEICQRADILVAAVGRAEIVKGDWIKPGAIVIDVGTNRVDDPTAKNGYRLVGDVAFDEAKEIAGAITPVPGGVGPMTITMLLQNTLRAAQLAVDSKVAE
ncbi:MAG: bifunctional methylenetetrahydrofolate dehydrogenase/methenyltetrahydrofolate cyclohydrolase FolD [Chloroflexi bacterium]|nr:bifunctional methylenetetrahydrofolate dehydrogenase/methenyltetrahydrofolate cyclohydrolase FolD [Chloroflexota bacterium]